jgi:Flp pilus assembly protein TadD
MPATAAAAATPPTPAPGLDADARLARARDAVTRGRWSEALAEARAVLDRQPTNTEATALAQRAEEEVVIEECLKNARAAIAAGDRERALEELRRGSLIRKNDPRLLEVFREAAQQ